MTQREVVIQELDTLPSDKMVEVLDFIRFLKVRVKSDEELRREFRSALAQARAIAAERGITEADIAEEIRKVRVGHRTQVRICQSLRNNHRNLG